MDCFAYCRGHATALQRFSVSITKKIGEFHCNQLGTGPANSPRNNRCPQRPYFARSSRRDAVRGCFSEAFPRGLGALRSLASTENPEIVSFAPNVQTVAQSALRAQHCPGRRLVARG